jgi:integrase/recombinase XerD
MATVSIIYRKDKLNKKGEAPIHFRIIKDRKISYISSGIMIPEEHWDGKNNRIKGKHQNSARLNSFISNKFTELQDQVFEHDTISKSLTTRQLRDKIYGKKATDFFEFADEAVERYLQNGKIGTYDKNCSIITKLREYMNGKTLAFQDITSDFLTKYEKHLREKHHNTTNTVYKDYKFIRRLFNDAYSQDIIEHNVIPFNKYKMKSEKTQRSYLTEDELLQIEELSLTPGTRIELHRNMFVFSAYAGGLRVSDVLQLKWKDFDGHHINVTIMKTGGQLSIKLPNRSLEIIKKYKPAKANNNAFIFPQLPEDIKLTNAREVDTEISRATAYINKNLKIIAIKLKIEKNISFHISRHTFATRALRKGISIDKVSKILGHAAIRETQIYAKIVSSELDKAMDIFNE